jgi:hypothetical protein
LGYRFGSEAVDWAGIVELFEHFGGADAKGFGAVAGDALVVLLRLLATASGAEPIEPQRLEGR